MNKTDVRGKLLSQPRIYSSYNLNGFSTEHVSSHLILVSMHDKRSYEIFIVIVRRMHATAQPDPPVLLISLLLQDSPPST